MKAVKTTTYLDYFGITASGICAIHCALLPLLSLFPIISTGFIAHSWFEVFIIGISVCIGVVSLTVSYFKHHKMLKPLLLLLSGFVLIYLGHNYELLLPEPLWVVAGGLCIAYAHYVNKVLSKKAVKAGF